MTFTVVVTNPRNPPVATGREWGGGLGDVEGVRCGEESKRQDWLGEMEMVKQTTVGTLSAPDPTD